MTGKVKGMLMDIEAEHGDNFEYWESSNTSHEEIEDRYGWDVLKAYMNWIYMECK